MDITIDENWLEQHGVLLGDENADELIDAALDEYELRVGTEIIHRLTPDQIATFEAIADEDERIQWLEEAIPDYQKITDEKFKELGEELQKSDDKITLLRGWTAE